MYVCYKIMYAARLEEKATFVVNVKCFLGTDFQKIYLFTYFLN